MITVHFENIYSKIIKEIKNAKSEIKLCVAWFTDYDLYAALVKKSKQGLKIKIIVANHEFNHNSNVDFKELLKYNCQIWHVGDVNSTSRDSLMHNKFCLIDDCTIITGSYNWTFKARMNQENILIIKNEKKVFKNFLNQFEKIQPQNAFVLENNKVALKAIQQIINKWEESPQKNKSNAKLDSTGKSISDKF